MQMVDRKVQVSFFVYLILFLFYTAVLALPEVENPYLAHHFYMPGIWTPVLVFIQRKFVTICKVCNKKLNSNLQQEKVGWIL